MRRILPYLFVLYVIAYLDRVNVSYAALALGKEPGFTAEVLGFGGGIFFIGYVALEIPGALLVEKWSARGWIARIMISWGLLAAVTGFINTPRQFYWVRFLLGAAEAGFFPGLIVYLTHWFRSEDRAKAVGIFMAALPVSNLAGSPVSGLVMRIHWLGLAGWRWLFIIEGIPAVIAGITTIFYLTDRPSQAKWLDEEERAWITQEMETEKREKELRRSEGQGALLPVILLTLSYFFIVTCVYGFNFWMPSILQKVSGLSILLVTLVAMLPFGAGLGAILTIGWSSDRTGERRWHTSIPMVVGGTGLLLMAVMQRSTPAAVGAACIAAIGLYSYLPGFWALTTQFLSGSAAAVAIATVNLIGNLGGFAGPYVVGHLKQVTNSFLPGMASLAACSVVAAMFIVAIRQPGKMQYAR